MRPAVPRRPDARRRRGWLPVVALLVVGATPVVIEALRGLVHAGSDLGTLFLPNWAWWWERWRFGAGWNPWLFAGYPADADPLLSRFHPFGALYALGRPEVAMAIEGALLEVVSAVGMYAYLRRVGCSRAGGLLGALAFGAGGFTAGHAVHPPLLRSTMVIPWALLAIEMLEGPMLAAGLGACVAVVLLGGHPQTIVYSVLLCAVYAAWLGRPTQERRPWWLVGAAVLGVGLAAAALVPPATFIPSTTRVDVTPIFPSPTLALAETWRLVVPYAAVGMRDGATAHAALRCGPAECAGYPGAVSLVVVAAALPALLRSVRGRFWLVVAAVAIVAATGTGPTLTGVRGPARFLLYWNVALAAATGLGFDALQRTHAAPRGWRIAAPLALVITSAWLLARGGL